MGGELAAGAQAHLDPLVFAVEQRHVVEVGGVEVRLQLTVEHVQDVAVELGRDPLGVVVGGLQGAGVLHQVGAQQQVVAVRQQTRDLAQDAPPRAGRKVADRAAQEGHDARAGGGRDVAQVALEVADHAVHAQARVLLDQAFGAAVDHALGHVDGDVALERAGRLQRVEQHARLGRGPGAELDELAGAGQLGQLLGALLEDRPLGAGRVVLGQLADAVEQLRPARVVEVLRRQLLERPREAVEHVLGQRPLLRSVEVASRSGSAPPRALPAVVVASCLPRQAHAREDLAAQR